MQGYLRNAHPAEYPAFSNISSIWPDSRVQSNPDFKKGPIIRMMNIRCISCDEQPAYLKKPDEGLNVIQNNYSQ